MGAAKPGRGLVFIISTPSGSDAGQRAEAQHWTDFLDFYTTAGRQRADSRVLLSFPRDKVEKMISGGQVLEGVPMCSTTITEQRV